MGVNRIRFLGIKVRQKLSISRDTVAIAVSYTHLDVYKRQA